MQRFGVGLRGDSGPKAPIVLGTKSFSLSGIFLDSFFVWKLLAILERLFKLTLFAEFNDIVESFNVHSDCQRNILLTHRREKGTGETLELSKIDQSR